MQKSLFFIGLAVAAVAIVAMLMFGNIINPAPTIIIAAGQDIPAGTLLSELPEAALVRVPVSGDEIMIGSLVTPQDYNEMIAAGGEFVEPVVQYEPLRLSSIASSANPAGDTLTSLANSDPGMVITVINVEGIAPDGIRSGDRIDLAVAVKNVGFDESYYNTLADLITATGANASEDTDLNSTDDSADSEDAPVEEWVGNSPPYAYSLPENVRPTTEDLAPYFFQSPLAKIIVRNARVVNVVREEETNTTASSSGSAMSTTTETVQGAVMALEIQIPREAFEWVTMANAAGDLNISLISPLAKDEDTPPSLGASLQDLLEQFYTDRGLDVRGKGTIPTP
jgi:hypothetical protein